MDGNYILFMPSLISRTTPLRYTTHDTDRVYEAVQTNIPATLYVLDKLRGQGEKLTKIVMLCSGEVETEVRIDGMTSRQYCEHVITGALRERDYTEAEIGQMFLSFPLSENAIQGKADVERIQNQIADALPVRGNLYLDYTGGMRSAAMVLVFLARFLEKRGMVVRDVIYSNILRKDPQGRVESCRDIYDYFNWLDGVQEAQRGHTDTVTALAQKEGKTKLAQTARQTAQTMEKVRSGQQKAIRAEELQETAPAESGLVAQVVQQVINTSRKKLREGTVIEQCLRDDRIDDAARYVREDGVKALQKSGLLRFSGYWQDPKQAKRIENTFYGYIAYYRSYLGFLEKFLAGGGRTVAELNVYCAAQPMIAPKKLDAFRSSPFLEREFARHCPELLKPVEEAFFQKVLLSYDASEAVGAVEGYLEKRRETMAAFYHSGFPYGLLYANSSYLEFGYLWLPEVFMEQARRDLKVLPDDWSQKPMTELFPPPVVRNFFTPAKPRTFGAVLLLMEQIRQARNGMIHQSDLGNEGLEQIRTHLRQFDAVLRRKP